jgi:hypothetical protein
MAGPTVNDSAPSGAGDPFSYIFGGNTGLSYEELKRRRAIATALAGQKKGFPKNTGEGLTYLGESIGEAGLNWRLAQMEKAQKEAEASIPTGGAKLSGEPVPMAGPPGSRYTPPPAVTTTPPGGAERPVTPPAPRAEADTGVTVAAADQAPAEQPTTLAYAPSSTPDETQLSTPVSAPPARAATPFFARPQEAPLVTRNDIPLTGGTGTGMRAPGMVPFDWETSGSGVGGPGETYAVQGGLQKQGAQRLADMQGNAAALDPNLTASPQTFQRGGNPGLPSYFQGNESVRSAGYNEMDAAVPNVAANVPIPRSRPGPAEPGVYDPGQLNPIDQAMLNRNDPRAAGVNSRILEDVAYGSLALPQGSRVELTSGQRTGDSGFHGRHSAADFHIVDPEGNVIRNRGQDTSGLYTELARGAYTGNQKNYPGQPLAWGGAFDTAKRGGTGNRDLMHFDTGPERGNLDPNLRLSRLGPLPNDPGADPTFASVASTPRQAVANSMAIIQARDAPPSQSDATQVARVQDVLGMGGQGSAQPRTASLGRTGVVSDAPPLGVNPVNADPAIAASIQQRNAIAKELLDQQQKVPAPQEVPQTDPTSTGVTPPTTATASPASTAAETSSTSPNPQYAQAATPGRVMDIQPAPSWLGGAQAPARTPDPFASAPSAATGTTSPPAPQAIPQGAAEPSGIRQVAPPETLPPYKPQEFKDPGPPPPRPKLLGASQAETYWGNVKDNPNVSDGMRAYAERQYNVHKQYRTDTQAGQINDYVNQRQQWEKDKNEYDKGIREADPRYIKEQTEREALLKARNEAAYLAPAMEAKTKAEAVIQQAIASRQPVLEAQARADLEKANLEIRQKQYELDTKNAAELAQTQAQTKHTQLENEAGVMPPHVLIGSQVFEFDPKDRTKMINVTPTFNPSHITPTAEQAKLISQYERSLNAKQYLTNPAVLADLTQTQRFRLPGGNYMVSNDFRTNREAALNWMMANLRNDSGAVINKDEAEQHFELWFPAPGDKADQIKFKDSQRAAVEHANYSSLGSAQPIVDQFHRKLGIPTPNQDTPDAPSTSVTAPLGGSINNPVEGAVLRNKTTGAIEKVRRNGQWVKP